MKPQPLAKCRVCGTPVFEGDRVCGTPVFEGDLIKTWECTPKAKAGEIRVFISLWKCPVCGIKFRTADRIWPKEKGKLQVILERLKKHN